MSDRLSDDDVRLIAERTERANAAVAMLGLGVHDPGQDLAALCREVLAQRERERWQPMATAPKDGREVLLLAERRAGVPGKMLVGHYMPGGYCIEDHPAIDEGWYFWNGSRFDNASKPTHWMPLPEAPTGDSQ